MHSWKQSKQMLKMAPEQSLNPRAKISRAFCKFQKLLSDAPLNYEAVRKKSGGLVRFLKFVPNCVQ